MNERGTMHTGPLGSTIHVLRADADWLAMTRRRNPPQRTNRYSNWERETPRSTAGKSPVTP